MNKMNLLYMKGFMKSTFLSVRFLSLLTIIALSSASFVKAQVTVPPYRINCGGEAFTDAEGNAWEADDHFTGGQAYLALSPTSYPLLTTAYQSERWFEESKTRLTYSFDAPAGEYKVRLHFAEIYDSAAVIGARVFEVWVNGAFGLGPIDVFSEAGAAYTPLIKDLTVNSNGTITLDFVSKIGHAKINGIEVIPNFIIGIKNGANKTSLTGANLGAKLDLQGSEYTYRSAFTGAYTLKLRNARGQVALTQNGQGKGEMHLVGLKPGIYFLEAKPKN